MTEQRITSRKNPFLQQVKKLLSSKKAREEAGLFVSDGTKLLAEAVGRELGLEPVQTLKKIRHNPKQSRTADPAKRRANVLGVYQAVHPERFHGKRILLVDDVLTTGATLSECGKTLRIAGAEELVCAVIAVAHRDHKK